MADYIRRILAKAQFTGNFQSEYPTALIHALLDDVPSEDVRPVVLCRDCKRYGGRPWENNETGTCGRTDFGVSKDDFCSFGEKREES